MTPRSVKGKIHTATLATHDGMLAQESTLAAVVNLAEATRAVPEALEADVAEGEDTLMGPFSRMAFFTAWSNLPFTTMRKITTFIYMPTQQQRK